MKIILLGASGSGKGTIAKKISADFKVPQISTGDIFRDIIKRKSTLGEQVKSYINYGKLVPDDITLKVLRQRLKRVDCQNGFILDGFPRNIDQAKSLSKISDIDIVLNIELPLEELEKRLVNRRICAKCGDIDSTKYSGFTGYCRKCGTKLFQRDDDKPEIIKTRLEVYKNQVSPLINFYGDKVQTVSNSASPDETYARVKTFLLNLEAKA